MHGNPLRTGSRRDSVWMREDLEPVRARDGGKRNASGQECAADNPADLDVRCKKTERHLSHFALGDMIRRISSLSIKASLGQTQRGSWEADQ